jgi:lysozyme
MKQPLTALELLTSIIKDFEGLRLKAYLCPAGKYTVGWGATGKGINKDTVWTKEQAENDVHNKALQALHDAVDVSPILSYQSFEKQAAIADFIYNCGLGAYKKSTLKRRVDAMDWEEARKEILRWDKVGGKPLAGLTRRRKKECELLG